MSKDVMDVIRDSTPETRHHMVPVGKTIHQDKCHPERFMLMGCDWMLEFTSESLAAALDRAGR